MPLWAVLVWLAVWQLAAWWVDAPILLVSPLTALKRLLELAFEAAFWRAVAFSVGRILLGFLLSALLGAVLAAAAYRFRRVRELLMPLVAAVKAVPVASFVILVLLWVSSRNLSVVISLLIGFPVIYANVLAGLDSTDPRLIEMARVFRVPFRRQLSTVYLSQVAPFLRSGLSLAIGLCWKSGVAAEVIGIPSGSIGEKLYKAKIYLETPDLFCFGSYGRNMVPYFGITDDPADRTLLGYAWKSQPYGQVTKADERLDVTSICMLPKGLQRLSLACHCDPLVLSRAIASLDGMQDVPGLNMVFDEMKRARPSSITAPAYYEAKVTEAAAMLLDWSLANARGAASAIRAADRSALNLTRAHIREHLDRAVPSSELCRIACMSASKLTRLFKQAEGMTPQEYARTLRMERACELLGDTDLSMAEIAARLGFARQGSFSEAFKERFGATPQEFRALRAARRSAR